MEKWINEKDGEKHIHIHALKLAIIKEKNPNL